MHEIAIVLMNHGDEKKIELNRVEGMQSFGSIEGVQTVSVLLAGSAECEERRGTALGTSGGLPPRHPVADRLNSDLVPIQLN
jgi:hypothetical protein